MAVSLEMEGILEITEIAADWNYRTDGPTNWPARPRLLSISFTPGAVGDKLMVRQRDATGPEAAYFSCENDTEPRIQYFHGTVRVPYINFAQSTLSVGHKVVVSQWREP